MDPYTKSNLISFIYLLLNINFQSAIKKMREYLDIPTNGFSDTESYYRWRNTFFQAVGDYQKAKKISLKQNRVITFTEKQIVKLLKGKVSLSTVFQNPEDALVIVVLKLLRIGKDRNIKLWGRFFYHLIFTFNPKELFSGLHDLDVRNDKISISKDYFSGSVSLVIPLALESTINSIQTMIKKNKSIILQTIKELRVESSKTNIEALNIKRDYFIYNTYTSHKSQNKRFEDIYDNVRKEIAVTDRAEVLLKKAEFETIESLGWESMRKIVSRMNKRIKQSFTDKSDGIGNLFNAIESTEPAPYPEFVADRLITH
ncbi:MAG: hypothetical protein WCT85_00900 [Parachlamydiales bacterium]